MNIAIDQRELDKLVDLKFAFEEQANKCLHGDEQHIPETSMCVRTEAYLDAICDATGMKKRVGDRNPDGTASTREVWYRNCKFWTPIYKNIF